MGSDSPPQELFEGVLHAAKQYTSEYVFVVFATQNIVSQLAQVHIKNRMQAQVIFHVVEEFVEMHDEPLLAVRRKKKSSLRIGMGLLKLGQIDAFISAGNTGALITCARIMLSKLPSIQRPALLTLLPTKKKTLAIVDAGGNIKDTATSLLQYAHMGITYQRCCAGITCPTVGLLNIGTEANKGPALIRQVYLALQAQAKDSRKAGKGFTFAGNVEARELFKGDIDVLVSDGFTGNVMLKAIEGTAAFVLDSILNLLQAPTTLEAFQSRFDYSEYPGALVCGVDGVVVKCHGDACAKSIYNAVRGSIFVLNKKLIPQIKEDLTFHCKN